MFSILVGRADSNSVVSKWAIIQVRQGPIACYKEDDIVISHIFDPDLIIINKKGTKIGLTKFKGWNGSIITNT